MGAFLFYLATMGTILCGSMLLPAFVAFGLDEVDAGYRILLYGASGGFFCTAVLLAIVGRVGGLRRNTAILLGITSWIVFPMAMALPISDLANISWIDAVFQSVSAFTTTGSLVFENNASVPRSVFFLLAQFQWLGGFATLVTLILVLAPWEIGGLPQVSSASIAASIVASQRRLINFCTRMFQTYLFITILCFIALLLVGIGPFDAAMYSYASLSTGGIVDAGEGADLLLGVGGMMVVAAFLLIGATSVFWHEDIFRFDSQALMRPREGYFILAVFAVLAVFIAFLLARAAGSSSVLPANFAFAEGMFNAASIVSTSGMQSRPGVFALIPPTLILLFIFMGGGCYSTAGGIKFFRIGGIFSLSQYELNRLIYPNIVRGGQFGTARHDMELMKAMWSLFAVLIATVAVVSSLLSVSGLGFQQSFTAAIAAISNAGPLYGSFWSDGSTAIWPDYFEMSAAQKIILTVTMFIGRLEVIAVFASISVFFRSLR